MRRYNSFKLEGRRQNYQKQQDLALYAPYSGLNGIYRAMSEQSTAIRNIYNNPYLSADEKRQHIDQLYGVKIEFAKRGLEQIKQIDDLVNKRKKGRLFGPPDELVNFRFVW